MAWVFGTDYTGCFVGMSLTGNFHSTGISGLSKASFLSSKGSRGYIITNVEYDTSIKYFILPCFNKSATLYAFGRDWEKNMVNISITALVGSASQLNSRGSSSNGTATPFTTMNAMMARNNVMERPEPASIYVRGKTVATGHLVGMSTATQSVANNVQSFNLTFVLNTLQIS